MHLFNEMKYVSMRRSMSVRRTVSFAHQLLLLLQIAAARAIAYQTPLFVLQMREPANEPS